MGGIETGELVVNHGIRYLSRHLVDHSWVHFDRDVGEPLHSILEHLLNGSGDQVFLRSSHLQIFDGLCYSLLIHWRLVVEQSDGHRCLLLPHHGLVDEVLTCVLVALVF